MPDRDEVQVWWSSSTGSMVDAASAMALLDDAESARAGRFHFERDRVRFVSRHAFVRGVLARYLNVEPADVVIRTAPQGRPELDRSCGISFNVSSADDLAVVVVTQGYPVGVDIERIRHIDDALDIAEGMFADPEVALLRSGPQPRCSRTFLSLWTRKESFVKAVGGGLSIPLDGFSVVQRDGHADGRLFGRAGILPFSIVQLDAPDSYIGAVTLGSTRIALTDMGSVVGNS